MLCYEGDHVALKAKLDELAIASRNDVTSSSTTKKEWSQLEKTFKKNKRRVVNKALSKAKVVFSTLNRYVSLLYIYIYIICFQTFIKRSFFVQSSGSAVMRNQRFDTVIIDEVGQATEPDYWIALLKAKKAIFVMLKK